MEYIDEGTDAEVESGLRNGPLRAEKVENKNVGDGCMSDETDKGGGVRSVVLLIVHVVDSGDSSDAETDEGDATCTRTLLVPVPAFGEGVRHEISALADGLMGAVSISL